MKLNSLVSLVAATAGVAQGAASPDDSLAIFAKRRTADLAQFPDPTWFTKIDTWLSSQKGDGTWSDVNYLSGCPARKSRSRRASLTENVALKKCNFKAYENMLTI
jgi:hypothetical protein